MRTAIVRDAIDVARLIAEARGPHNGATVVFLGTVRDVNEGRPVSGMEYTAYEAMAARELAHIVEEATARFETRDVIVEHRVGSLALGDVSVAVVVASAHRDEAFEGARYIVEELKTRVPIWKLEHYVDGTREWVDPTARPAAVGMADSASDRAGDP